MDCDLDVMDVYNNTGSYDSIAIDIVLLSLLIHDTLSIVKNEENSETTYDSIDIHQNYLCNEAFSVTHISAEANHFINANWHVFFLF